ncbi:MAG: hypothetical protein EAX96_12690 [Candidatus Lokiarchaeota archaeon]|nr:hypothetical protein [Candidatus Lokiarchaeota archaeon]
MEIFKRWKRYIEISEVGPLVRRFFVMNAFDGSLTTLGIIIGAWVGNGGFFNMPASLIFSLSTIRFIVLVGLATAFSMGVSGIWGSYLTEEAEREKEQKEIERAMVMTKKTFRQDSEIVKAQKFGSKLCALVDGLSPAMAAIICLIPFFLGLVLPLHAVAFLLSMACTFTVLICLGLFLGKISEKSLGKSALKMAIAGLLITVLFIVLPLG